MAYDGSKNIIRRFESLDAMAAYHRSVASKVTGGHFGYQSGWKQTEETMLNGDLSLVPEAEKLMEELEASVESVGPVWSSDVHGGRFCYPDYLANSPTPFRRMKSVSSDLSPIRIFVGIVCSAMIGPEAMRKRGLAIMALAMQLQAIRPVEVILYHESEAGGWYGSSKEKRDCLYTINLESRPISLAHCINALANVYVARHLTYAIAETDGFEGGWPHGYNGGKPSKDYQAWREKVLEVTEHDLLLESAYIGDEILENPVAWINKHLSLYTEAAE